MTACLRWHRGSTTIKPIEWKTAEGVARDDYERSVLAELRLLADLTRVCRDPEGLGPVTELDRQSTISSVPGTWGTLRILEFVGRGAFGKVYRARDNLDREVALKLFPVASGEGGALARRVLQEGSLLAKVKHQNVVIVHGVDRVGDYVGLWMEFIRGRTMEEELRVRGTLSAEEATTIGVDLCQALAAVHSRGLLHRDVKAQNVMREVGGRTVLMDFGAGSEQRFGATSALDVAGTPLYLAPELFEDGLATQASDIYSLGVILYRMVTGRYPVDGMDKVEIRLAHRDHKRQRLRDARPDLSNGFVRAVERALAPDPRERYQTAAEFEEALTGSTVVRRSPLDWSVWLRRAAAVAGVALLIATPIWWILSSQHDQSRSIASGSTPPLGPIESSATAATSTPYTVKATFTRQRDQKEVSLAAGDRVAPGDRLALRIEASTSVYVYVVNADEQGESYLLFPLRGREPANPLAASRVHRLPGQEGGREVHWLITSDGGREHFLVFASPTVMTAVESILQTLPGPEPGRPVAPKRLPEAAIGRLRSVGGLVAADVPRKPGGPAAIWFETADALTADVETVHGPWLRQFTLQHQAR